VILTAGGLLLMTAVAIERISAICRHVRMRRAKQTMRARMAAAVKGKTEQEVVALARKVVEDISARFGRALTAEECRAVLGDAHTVWASALQRSANSNLMMWFDAEDDADTTVKS
jgi:hypothetical protein